jgi:hypothetical protein
MRNAVKMFSFDPNPTTARKAWSSSTCLLYEVNYGGRSPKFIWAPCHVMCTAVLIG